MLNMAI